MEYWPKEKLGRKLLTKGLIAYSATVQKYLDRLEVYIECIDFVTSN